MDSYSSESSCASNDSLDSNWRKNDTYTTQTQLNTKCVVWTNSQLFYIGQDCRVIPEALGDHYGDPCRRLDLSFNCISNLSGLHKFTNLEELILDNNQLDDSLRLPYLPQLRTLSLNKNKIKDLEGLLDKVVVQLPSLRYLSLLGNPACPTQLSCLESDEEDYQRYRFRVIYRLPKLNFLDSTSIKKPEKAEAVRVGPYTKIVRPSLPTTLAGSGSDSEDDDRRYTPLPKAITHDGTHKGAYGVCRYKYLGLHSEGNRFIRNNDL